MRLALVLALTVLAGCAGSPWLSPRWSDPAPHLEYLVRAQTAAPEEREAMWQAAVREPPGEVATLHRALLRTVGGHSGYDLAAAEIELQGLLSQSPPADIAPVARARLEDLHAANGCRTEVENLKRRLSKVADIEKRMDQERH